MKMLTIFVAFALAVSSVEAAAKNVTECQALLSATYVNPVFPASYSGSVCYSDSDTLGEFKAAVCKPTCRAKFDEQYTLCKDTFQDAAGDCNAVYDDANNAAMKSFCDKVVTNHAGDGDSFCSVVTTIAGECKAQFDLHYGSKTECHYGTYTNLTRASQCTADLTNNMMCSEGLFKLFRQVGFLETRNWTAGPQVCSAGEIKNRWMTTVYADEDAAFNAMGNQFAGICRDANPFACDWDGATYNTYYAIWGTPTDGDGRTVGRYGTRCPTPAEAEYRRASECDTAYFTHPAANELNPGFGYGHPVTGEYVPYSSCLGDSVHDMMCFDNNASNTKCQDAKTELYALCIDNSNNCAYNDTGNAAQNYAKNYCKHIVEVKDGTKKCDAPLPPPPSPPPYPSPSPPPTKEMKTVVTTMVISVTGEVDVEKLKANAAKAGSDYNGGELVEADVTVTYGTTVGSFFKTAPDETKLAADMAKAFGVPAAQVSVARSAMTRLRRRLLQASPEEQAMYAAFNEGYTTMMTTTILAPDYATAKSIEASAITTASSAVAASGGKALMVRTSATVTVEVQLSVLVTGTVYLSGNQLSSGLGEDVEVLVQTTAGVEKATLPPANPPSSYLKSTAPSTPPGAGASSGSGASSESGASRVAATAIAIVAAVVALCA